MTNCCSFWGKETKIISDTRDAGNNSIHLNTQLLGFFWHAGTDFHHSRQWVPRSSKRWVRKRPSLGNPLSVVFPQDLLSTCSPHAPKHLNNFFFPDPLKLLLWTSNKNQEKESRRWNAYCLLYCLSPGDNQILVLVFGCLVLGEMFWFPEHFIPEQVDEVEWLQSEITHETDRAKCPPFSGSNHTRGKKRETRSSLSIRIPKSPYQADYNCTGSKTKDDKTFLFVHSQILQPFASFCWIVL